MAEVAYGYLSLLGTVRFERRMHTEITQNDIGKRMGCIELATTRGDELNGDSIRFAFVYIRV
ncbi:MAG: hypothetical protein RL645_525 [Actinomycetota bacterium]